jgi:endonuclease/exonuclease/phosphatase family metal-dependent hydrolase
MTRQDVAPTGQIDGATTTASIALVSLNIRCAPSHDGTNSWPYRREWVPTYVRDLDADVLGLQEAFDEQVRAIHAGLPGHDRVGVGRDDGVRAGEYCAIFYRADRFALQSEGTFWFSDTPDVAGSRTWGTHHNRICTWALLTDRHTGRSLRICNLHLDHEVELARFKSVHLLGDYLSGWNSVSPVVIMGDFNVDEDDRVVRYLQDREPDGLVDTFRAVHPDDTAVATYHGFTGGESGAKIDYILATRDMAVLDASIIRTSRDGRYPSDHFPVAARIALNR